MNPRKYKDTVFQLFAQIAHSFASAKRLEIIDVLIQGERDVETISKQVKSTVANTSRHLQILKNTRLVESRKEGARVIYRIADSAIIDCWKSLQILAEKRLPDLKEITRLYHDNRDEMEGVTKDDLILRINRKKVIVLDVRPEEEYKSGHIQGAISIPLDELKTRLKNIPKNTEIVAYCRGPYCVMAIEAVKLLNRSGYKALRYKEGFPEWQKDKLPIEN